MKKSVRIFAGLFILSTIVFFVTNSGEELILRWQMNTFRYSEVVERYSEMMDIDSNLVYAIIKRESNFRVNAVSHVGASGLMQIMERTAVDVSERMGFHDFSMDNIFEPEVNIRIGAWYISHLLSLYDGNLINALAAYNAGQGNVNEWLSDPYHVGESGSLRNIPFTETREYVERVLSTMQMLERINRR